MGVVSPGDLQLAHVSGIDLRKGGIANVVGTTVHGPFDFGSVDGEGQCHATQEDRHDSSKSQIVEHPYPRITCTRNAPSKGRYSRNRARVTGRSAPRINARPRS